jgi:hypothetical protein
MSAKKTGCSGRIIVLVGIVRMRRTVNVVDINVCWESSRNDCFRCRHHSRGGASEEVAELKPPSQTQLQAVVWIEGASRRNAR